MMTTRLLDKAGRWARDNHHWILPLTRGALNAGAVTIALRQAAHPLPAALAVALAAGLQSALLQWSPINERYARFLNRAGSEPARFLRWAVVSSSYYAVMQLAGMSVTNADFELGATLLLVLRTCLLGAAQYPWVAAIARRRKQQERRARRAREDIRFAADLHTMIVSAVFVALSALGAAGFGPSRLLLLAAGLLGLVCYLSLRGLLRFGPLARVAAQGSSFTMRAVGS